MCSHTKELRECSSIYAVSLVMAFVYIYSFGQLQGVPTAYEFQNSPDSLDSEDTLYRMPKEIDRGLHDLIKAYPDALKSAWDNVLLWKDGEEMVYDDGIISKSYDSLLNSPDLQDQMSVSYTKGTNYDIPSINFDPGRIRYEPFFYKMYGNSFYEVCSKLTTIMWLPGSVNLPLKVTTVNGVHEKLQAISNELDTLLHLHKYVDNPAGTICWRNIAGTDRLSMHSFGIAIDINVNHSDYWRWQERQVDERLLYKNRIPLKIVDIFERHGFIWGGKWYHFDTMHFEYRPELLISGE